MKATRRRAVRESRAGSGDIARPLLLDTHVWIGLLEDEIYKLPPPIVRAISSAQQAASVLVSDVSAWEVCMKADRGSMRLGRPLRDWLSRAQEAPGIQFVSLTRELMLRSRELQASSLTDPFDRAIVATAISEGATLVTADRRILDWARRSGELPVLGVHATRP